MRPRRTPDCALPPTMGTDPETTILTMFKEIKAKLEISAGNCKLQKVI